MRRPGRLFGWLTAAMLVGWGLSWALPRMPRTLAEVDWFRVRAVRVEGVRHLSAEEVQRIAAVPADANLWDDPAPVAARVRAHPLVREVAVSRLIPGTLRLRIVEREPVALLPTPTLEPVDVEGRRLPLDPARLHLDLPVLRPRRSTAAAAAPAAIAPAAREIARLAEAEPSFWANVSVVTPEGARYLVFDLSEPAVRLRVRIPLTPLRLREAMAVLDDATGRTGEPPAILDLRFADQVVIRRGETD
jgi:cell division protein FtsQ